MNAHSSRSHTVFTVTVHLKESSVDGNIEQYKSVNFIKDDLSILGTSPKRHFPKWQLPKCAYSQVCPSRSARPLLQSLT